MPGQISTKSVASQSDRSDQESGQMHLANISEFFPRELCPKTTVKVFVGTESEPFVIHKDVLCASSDFFKNACKPPWRESEGVVELRSTDPQLFDVYAQWLYIPDVIASISKKPILVTAADVPVYKPLFHLYILGDMLQDSSFRNAVLNKIVEVAYTVDLFPISYAAFLYSNLPPSSPLRRLYVDFWVGLSNKTWFDTKNPADDCNSPDVPMEFFRDVFKQSRTRRGCKKPWLANICQYHEHGKGIKCTPLVRGLRQGNTIALQKNE